MLATRRPALVGLRWARRFSSDEWSKLESKAERIAKVLVDTGEGVSVAELSSGGLISAALWTSPLAHQCFKGAGIRLAYGINRQADEEGVATARDFAKAKMSDGWEKGIEKTRIGQRERARWGLVYEDGVPHSEVGSPVHALELAHAAKFNLGTTWGIGESCVPGPGPHHRTGEAAGSGFVAVAGPQPESTGVLKLGPSDASRSANMLRFASAALDLMVAMQEKSLEKALLDTAFEKA
tara:strand:+ start:1823 stop:2536 length:714 start_codon:yes stop_codon:yes gene_type:complete